MIPRRNQALRLLAWLGPLALLVISCRAAPAAVSDSTNASDPTTVPDSATAADTADTAAAPATPATPDSATASDSATVSDSAVVSDSATSPVSTDAMAAAAVIRRYYQAINARQFRTAYLLWGEAGAASGRSFAEFADGFTGTGRVLVEVGEPGRLGAAAGSRYIEIPVVIRAEMLDGGRQRFEGRYTLRRAVVDGATAAQRAWHIYTAQITRTR